MTQTVTQPKGLKIADRVAELLRYIQSGRIIEAMNEFYAEDTVMQENRNVPTRGLAANIEREKQFLSQVKEWRGFEATATAVNGDVSFIESTMDFVATTGAEVHLEQVSVARWRDGKIVSERFYYDSAK
jgi:ketosteroid isomerase-like protein